MVISKKMRSFSNFKRVILVLGITLFFSLNLNSQSTANNTIKIRFLVNLKYKLIFEDAYTELNHNQFKRIVKSLVNNESIENLSCLNINIKTDSKDSSSICELLKTNEIKQIATFERETYIFDSIHFDFETIKKAPDPDLLKKIRHYSFSKFFTEEQYYFILQIEIQQLLGYLTGYNEGQHSHLKVNYHFQSLFEFHKNIAKVLNNHEDAHLSLFSRFTYRFYNQRPENRIRNVKITNNELIYIRSGFPLNTAAYQIDTLNLSNRQISILDTLKRISKTEYLTDKYMASFICASLIKNDSFNLKNQNGVHLLKDSILYIDISKTDKRSSRNIKKYSQKIINSVVIDLRGYPEDPIIGYKVLNRIKKLRSKKIAVLINKNTYSLAEIFASKLSQLDNSVILGECTAGAMGESNVVRVNDAFALKYTAYWYRKEAYLNASYRKVCPEAFLYFNLPAGYITPEELENILHELGKL